MQSMRLISVVMFVCVCTSAIMAGTVYIDDGQSYTINDQQYVDDVVLLDYNVVNADGNRG